MPQIALIACLLTVIVSPTTIAFFVSAPTRHTQGSVIKKLFQSLQCWDLVIAIIRGSSSQVNVPWNFAVGVPRGVRSPVKTNFRTTISKGALAITMCSPSTSIAKGTCCKIRWKVKMRYRSPLLQKIWNFAVVEDDKIFSSMSGVWWEWLVSVCMTKPKRDRLLILRLCRNKLFKPSWLYQQMTSDHPLLSLMILFCKRLHQSRQPLPAAAHILALFNLCAKSLKRAWGEYLALEWHPQHTVRFKVYNYTVLQKIFSEDKAKEMYQRAYLFQRVACKTGWVIQVISWIQEEICCCWLTGKSSTY